MKAVIKLFNALPIDDKQHIGYSSDPSDALIKKTVERGFIFSPEVLGNYSETQLSQLIDNIGLSAEEMNSSFHKSWKIVRDSSDEMLFIQQLVHYITTYGFKQLGIYDNDSVYIPNEQLDVPQLNDDVNLVVIHGLTPDEIKQKTMKMLSSGVALSQTSIECISVIVNTLVSFNENDMEKIANKEVRCLLYDHLNRVPHNNVEFLRYLIYQVTGSTLLIKNQETIDLLKTSKKIILVPLLEKYKNDVGLEKLAEIFYRFKPLFLAMKSEDGQNLILSDLKHTINRIRKLAKKYHKPMSEDYLNSITSRLNRGENFDVLELKSELDEVNTFRKIKLAYALKYRTLPCADSILYRVRNGKGYVNGMDFPYRKEAQYYLDVVVQAIVEDVQKNVNGKSVYIPDNISYALPSSEKQFVGNVPNGTCVYIPNDMVYGVHWNNVEQQMVDLDLAQITADGSKIGWDGSYRTGERNIMFSGDVTNAPEGASELFYMKANIMAFNLVTLNYFNYNSEVSVPFDIVVAEEKVKDFNSNYMVNPNNVKLRVSSEINRKQEIVGLVSSEPEGCSFILCQTSVGKSITSGLTDITQMIRSYLAGFYNNMIDLEYILNRAGVKILKDRDAEYEADIVLSPEKIDKNSIIEMFS